MAAHHSDGGVVGSCREGAAGRLAHARVATLSAGA
jgi:hypothetical protein